MAELREAVLNFFRSLKCIVEDNGDYFLVKNIPEKIESKFNLKSPMKLFFSKEKYSGDGYLIDENSDMIKKIKDYLKNSSTKTLLKLDFDFPNNIKDKFDLGTVRFRKLKRNMRIIIFLCLVF